MAIYRTFLTPCQSCAGLTRELYMAIFIHIQVNMALFGYTQDLPVTFQTPCQSCAGLTRHPRGVQGVQNEPKCVPEASRRRPRVSKKRPEGAKVDLVVFYSSKLDPEGILEVSRASKISPNAFQRRPRRVQKTPKNVKEATRRRKTRFSRVL